MEPPRFAVDRMLGRLARWLRLLGFDTAYRADLPGARLVTLAAREGRIAVTRDASLRRVGRGVPLVVLCADGFREQLRELDRAHPLGGFEARPARCSLCNVLLERLAAHDVPEKIPPYVRATQTEFQRCPACRRVYWPATHLARMSAEIAALGLTRPAA